MLHVLQYVVVVVVVVVVPFYSWFLGSKFCPSLLDIISLRIPTCSVRNYNQFFATRKNCPSARCAAAVKLVCCDTDIFSEDTETLKQILRH